MDNLFAKIQLDIPVFDLHSAIFFKVEMHLEGAVPQLRLVRNLATEAFRQSHLVVLGQDRLVIRMGALLDDNLGAVTRTEAAQVGQTLLGNNAVKVVLGMVNVRAMRHNA